MPSPTPHTSLVSDDVERAVACIRSGGLVAIPTETVYGLAADASNPAAVARIFSVKGRPSDHPLIVHISADATELNRWVAPPTPPQAVEIANRCWPGPLTMVLPANRSVGHWVTGGRPTVGVRSPQHLMTEALLSLTGCGLAAPSANRFGKVSPTSAAHVERDIGSLLDPTRDMILDGGPCGVGVESTIIDLTTTPAQLLRAGALSTASLESILASPLADARGPSRAPGMLQSHYAPNAAVWIADDAAAAAALEHNATRNGWRSTSIDRPGDGTATAYHLYHDLRQADIDGLDVVIFVVAQRGDLWAAIRDRLTRAAAGRTRHPD